MSQLELGLVAAPQASDVAPVPAPPLWGPNGELLLPERVRLISLWQPYASLVLGLDGAPGRKSLETRTWRWPYDASWLAIYATQTPKASAYKRIFGETDGAWRLALGRDQEAKAFGAIIGLVWIAGCRKMRHGDEEAACYPFEHSRFVWVIGASHRFRNPIPLKRGPQKFGSHPRAAIEEALRAA